MMVGDNSASRSSAVPVTLSGVVRAGQPLDYDSWMDAGGTPAPVLSLVRATFDLHLPRLQPSRPTRAPWRSSGLRRCRAIATPRLPEHSLQPQRDILLARVGRIHLAAAPLTQFFPDVSDERTFLRVETVLLQVLRRRHQKSHELFGLRVKGARPDVNDLALRYSQDRVKQARSYLKSIFDEAIEQEFLVKDPTRKLKIPKNLRPKDKSILSWEQMW